jgi:hypothetical protein
MSGMSVGRALAWGFIAAIAATLALLAVSFFGRLDLDLPGIVAVTSSGSAGPPQTSLVFNPLATIALALVLATILWSVSRVRRRRRTGRG